MSLFERVVMEQEVARYLSCARGEPLLEAAKKTTCAPKDVTVKALLHQDRNAIDNIFKCYHGDLLRFAISRVKTRDGVRDDLADEAVQDVYVKMLEGNDTFTKLGQDIEAGKQDPSRMFNVLQTAVVNAIRNLKKKYGARQVTWKRVELSPGPMGARQVKKPNLDPEDRRDVHAALKRARKAIKADDRENAYLDMILYGNPLGKGPLHVDRLVRVKSTKHTDPAGPDLKTIATQIWHDVKPATAVMRAKRFTTKFLRQFCNDVVLQKRVLPTGRQREARHSWFQSTWKTVCEAREEPLYRFAFTLGLIENIEPDTGIVEDLVLSWIRDVVSSD